MLAYKNVYSLQNGELVKNKENIIEYYDENGEKRVKTNPTYKDFAKVGKYPLKEENISFSELAEASPPPSLNGGEGKIVSYVVENGYIVPVYEKKEESDEY